MEKIHVSFIKDLRNREFSGLIDTLGDLFVGYESDNSSFIKATEKLQSHKKDLLKLKDTKPRHRLTRIINEKVRNRTEYLSCLRLRIEAALMSPLPEERIAADRLIYWIDPYRKSLFKPSITVQGQSVKDLKYDREKSADIQRFTALLNLDHVFETLVDITEEINTLFTERVEDRVSRAINGKEVRAAAYFDLQVLLSILKMMHHLSDSEEERKKLSSFSGEINGHLTRFRKELRSRNTKRRNKKEVDVAVKKLVGVEASESETISMSTNGEVKPEKTDLPAALFAQSFDRGVSEPRIDTKREMNNGGYYKGDNKKILYPIRKNGDGGKLPPINAG